MLDIILLDEDPASNVKLYRDADVISKCFQYAEILCHSHHAFHPYGGVAGIYKSVVYSDTKIFASQCVDSYNYVFSIWDNCLKEYKHRFGEDHPASTLVDKLKKLPKATLPSNKRFMDSFPAKAFDPGNHVFTPNHQIDVVKTARKEYIANILNTPDLWTKRNVREVLTTLTGGNAPVPDAPHDLDRIRPLMRMHQARTIRG